MKIIKKIEVEILKLKLATEDLKIAESNLKEGTEDLHFRLSYFRKQVSDWDIGLSNGTNDTQYLNTLKVALNKIMKDFSWNIKNTIDLMKIESM